VDEYVDGILDNNITILSQAITLVESSLQKHQEIAHQIIEKCLPYSGKSIRIGITGMPGVGKSTFIESLGQYIIKKRKLAVLAIDPSSQQSGGSILGDKTRMEKLVSESNVYIRPSPSSGTLGGVARKTRETIILCEAAGFDTILVETIGVGQAETKVHSMVDFFLLLMLAGAGDELQGIKRGIMEMADLIAITKSDGSNKEKTDLARSQFQNALHLFPPKESGWIPKVVTSSALENAGIVDIWNIILDYICFVKKSKYFDKKRGEQSKFWMDDFINESLKENFYNDKQIGIKLKELTQLAIEGKISPFSAARILLENYFKK
jgi:LAO/AO transport system kinase